MKPPDINLGDLRVSDNWLKENIYTEGKEKDNSGDTTK